MFFSIIFHGSWLDIKISSFFFSQEKGWIYRDNFYIERILHKGGVWLIIFMLLGIIYYFLKNSKKFSREKKLFYTISLLSSFVSILSITLMKHNTTFPCPWNSSSFSGNDVMPLFRDLFSSLLPHRHCYPAGHSSGGYSLLSFYVGHFILFNEIKLKWFFLTIVLGVSFGLTQVMRGAHFASHDLASISVILIISIVLFSLTKRYLISHEV